MSKEAPTPTKTSAPVSVNANSSAFVNVVPHAHDYGIENDDDKKTGLICVNRLRGRDCDAFGKNGETLGYRLKRAFVATRVHGTPAGTRFQFCGQAVNDAALAQLAQDKSPYATIGVFITLNTRAEARTALVRGT